MRLPYIIKGDSGTVVGLLSWDQKVTLSCSHIEVPLSKTLNP